VFRCSSAANPGAGTASKGDLFSAHLQHGGDFQVGGKSANCYDDIIDRLCAFLYGKEIRQNIPGGKVHRKYAVIDGYYLVFSFLLELLSLHYKSYLAKKGTQQGAEHSKVPVLACVTFYLLLIWRQIRSPPICVLGSLSNVKFWGWVRIRFLFKRGSGSIIL
jgi:hypothetical protein